MLSGLDLKLLRDLRHIQGQFAAVALVMGCGVAMMIMSRSLINSLETTRHEYYQTYRFANVFAQVKRAPQSLAARVAEIPGVGTVQTGLSVPVTLDIPGLNEPASGLVRSVPEFGEPELNRLFLRRGHWLAGGGRGEVLVGEAFAEANRLQPGDSIALLLHGRRQQLRVAGIVLSPEFVFESRPGTALPDNRTYGIFWMSYPELAAAYDLDGAFNYLTLSLAPGASERPVIGSLDRLLARYGGRGASGRAEHPSDVRLSDEIRVLHILAIGFPLVFLSVAAFMTNAVLTRLLALQREQIAVLKAFGYANNQIVWHYLKFAFAMVAAGTLIGCLIGVGAGRHVVGLYHVFFRFPDLTFRLDRSAVALALLVCAAAGAAGVLGAVRRAARLPPADAMRPEPPARYRPALVERTGIARWLSHTFRIAVRNLERKPWQALFTVVGLALATGILIVPNCLRDGINEVMDFQWDVVQRQDVGVGLVEPAQGQVRNLLRQLPGVMVVEPFRSVAVRLHHGHQHRTLAIQGISANGQHNRVVDAAYHLLDLTRGGLVVSAKLAEVIGARPGDTLQLETLEGKSRVLTVVLTGLAEDFAGMAAYMEKGALNRLLEEGDVMTGASFTIDAAQRLAFMRALKNIPRLSWVAFKKSLRENFRQTTAAAIKILQGVYSFFATVVAFGVVYNNARISLAEHTRELATLRVIGFSRREVGTVLVTELVLLSALAVPLGLLVGTGLATGLLTAVNTETVRLPLIFTTGNYAFAMAVVTVASTLSALLVLRRLNQLNLVSVLKAPE